MTSWILVSWLSVGAYSAPNYLRLHVFPARPTPILWHTPQALLTSLVAGLVTNRPHGIGHVSVEVKCGERHEWVGAVSESPAISRRLLLEDGLAFSVLERAWAGRLETEGEIRGAVAAAREKHDALSTVTFLVSARTYARVLNFLDLYRADSRPKYYGFAARPRYFEGSACTAFGAAFLEVAGLFSEDVRRAWLNEVRVPFALMPPRNGRASMSVLEASFDPAIVRWAEAVEPHMRLRFYDPERVHRWVREMDGFAHDPREEGGRLAVVLDRTWVPVPDEPLFRSEPQLVPMDFGTVGRGPVVGGSFELSP